MPKSKPLLTEQIVERHGRESLVLWVKRNWKIIAVVFAFLLIAIFAIIYFIKYQHINKRIGELQNGSKATDSEIKALVDEVGKLVVLPEGEEPTIATVTDPDKLSDQPFFVNAKSGDKVFIYSESRRAILYRPSEHKVIEIAPLNIDDPKTLELQPESTSSNESSTNTNNKPNQSSRDRNSNTSVYPNNE